MPKLPRPTFLCTAGVCFGIALLISTPVAAQAQVDCAKSPTYMRKIPGGQELVFHSQCEPPALTPKEGKKQPRMAPVSEPAPNPVPIAGAKPIAVSNAPPAANAGETEAKPKALNGHRNYSDRVRVQAYTRTRRQ